MGLIHVILYATLVEKLEDVVTWLQGRKHIAASFRLRFPCALGFELTCAPHLSAEQGMWEPAGEDWKVQLSFLTVEGLSRDAECVKAVAAPCT